MKKLFLLNCFNMVNKPTNNMNLGSFCSPRLVRDGPGFHRRFASYAGRNPILGSDKSGIRALGFVSSGSVVELRYF